MDTAKIRVRRTKKGPDEIVSGFTYTDSDSPIGFEADLAKDEFDMTPAQAAAAVATGGFEVDPTSKSEAEE